MCVQFNWIAPEAYVLVLVMWHSHYSYNIIHAECKGNIVRYNITWGYILLYDIHSVTPVLIHGHHSCLHCSKNAAVLTSKVSLNPFWGVISTSLCSWGQQEVCALIIQAYKECVFNSIRVPFTELSTDCTCTSDNQPAHTSNRSNWDRHERMHWQHQDS